MGLDQLLSYEHAGVALAISGVIGALKLTLKQFGVNDHKVFNALKPWLPLALGAIAALVPGAIQADEMGMKMIVGVAIGGISGQVWKVVDTNVKLVKGKL
jgi:hypothetical protein